MDYANMHGSAALRDFLQVNMSEHWRTAIVNTDSWSNQTFSTTEPAHPRRAFGGRTVSSSGSTMNIWQERAKSAAAAEKAASERCSSRSRTPDVSQVTTPKPQPATAPKRKQRKNKTSPLTYSLVKKPENSGKSTRKQRFNHKRMEIQAKGDRVGQLAKNVWYKEAATPKTYEELEAQRQRQRLEKKKEKAFIARTNTKTVRRKKAKTEAKPHNSFAILGNTEPAKPTVQKRSVVKKAPAARPVAVAPASAYKQALKLRKKIRECEKLALKQRNGARLDANQSAKLSKLPEFKSQLQALQAKEAITLDTTDFQVVTHKKKSNRRRRRY